MARSKKVAPPAPPPKTKAEQLHDAQENLAFYEEHLQRQLKQARETVVELGSKLSNPENVDPLYDLSWGGRTFEAAGFVKAVSAALYHREKGHSWRTIREEVLRETIRDCRSSSRSTSVTSNLAEDAHRQALASIYDDALKSLAKVEAKVESLAFEVQAESAERLTRDMAAALGASA
jgi:hypothetical protein